MGINFLTSNTKQKQIALIVISLLLSLSISAKEAVEHSTAKPTPASETKNKITDLRIIVDISGSMKKTDPKNLRRSAVRLLSGLVPEGSRAGIWHFAKQVNMAVKVGTVNEAWRKRAYEESKKINSVGLYTNIESAMRSVGFDWKKPDSRYNRNLILLTDGHVDVSDKKRLDEESKKRILKELLPQFEKADVKIHTIALSNNVDTSLLTTLSAYTDGLYKQVVSADDLQKLFLQMLEQSANLDTVPIKDNTFKVDGNVHDMTLLIFNKNKDRPTKIISPSNTSLSNKTKSASLKWFADDGYDLITIKKPQQGIWKIKAPRDKNNRVVVATNLKLSVSDLPSSLKPGDVLEIKAHLEEDGKPLTDKRLLSKFKFVVKQKIEGAEEQSYNFVKIDADDFSYRIQLAPVFKPGNNELVIQATSPTAEREIHHQFKVYSPEIKVKPKKEVEIKKVIPAPTTDNVNKDVKTSNSEADSHKEEKHHDEIAETKSHSKEEAHEDEKHLADDMLVKIDEIVKKLDVTNIDVTNLEVPELAVPDFSKLDWTTIVVGIVGGNIFLIGLVMVMMMLSKRKKAKMLKNFEEDEKQEEEDREKIKAEKLAEEVAENE